MKMSLANQDRKCDTLSPSIRPRPTPYPQTHTNTHIVPQIEE